MDGYDPVTLVGPEILRHRLHHFSLQVLDQLLPQNPSEDAFISSTLHVDWVSANNTFQAKFLSLTHTKNTPPQQQMAPLVWWTHLFLEKRKKKNWLAQDIQSEQGLPTFSEREPNHRRSYLYAQEEKEPFQGFMLMTKHFTSQTDPTAPSHNDPTNQVTVHKTTPIQVENFKYGCWCQMSWSEYFKGK